MQRKVLKEIKVVGPGKEALRLYVAVNPSQGFFFVILFMTQNIKT